MSFFWGASGHVLLDRDKTGHLIITDEFLKAYLARPELAPPQEACQHERALHSKLLAAPRADVVPAEITEMLDADARENWQVFINFRAKLLAAPSLEAAYLSLIREGVKNLPPLFLDQMAQIILRNALDGHEDAFVLRAAELFFRPQRITLHDNALLLADDATITDHEEGNSASSLHASPLLAMLGQDAVTALDVLKPTNAADYWPRSDLHDMVLDLGGKPSGRAALAEVLTLWIKHLLGIKVVITPQERIEDADWRWFVGLDQEATQIGNALWRGEKLAPEMMNRVLALFKLEALDKTSFDPKLAGKPVYLIMAMDDKNKLRLKPQNLVTGLPLVKQS